MDFDICKNNIENYIEQTPENVQEFYQNILKDINILMNDGDVEVEVEKIKPVVQSLVKDCFSGGTSNDRLTFYQSIMFLIYNWNNNTIKDADIFTYCFVVKKFISLMFPVKDVAKSIKDATEVINLSSRWLHPSLDISINYLNALFEKYEASEKETTLEQNINEKCCE